MKLDKHRLCTTSLFYLIRTTPHLHRLYASVTLKDTDRPGDILPWPKRRQIASFQGLWGYNTAELEGEKNLLLSLSSSSRGFWLCCCCSVKTSQQSSTDLHCPVVITQLVCVCACVCDRVCVCVCVKVSQGWRAPLRQALLLSSHCHAEGTSCLHSAVTAEIFTTLFTGHVPILRPCPQTPPLLLYT